MQIVVSLASAQVMTLLTIILPSDAVNATLNLISAENNNVFRINRFDEPNDQRLRKFCNLQRPKDVKKDVHSHF